MEAALLEAEDAGAGAIFVLGHPEYYPPEYYPRFGFYSCSYKRLAVRIRCAR